MVAAQVNVAKLIKSYRWKPLIAVVEYGHLFIICSFAYLPPPHYYGLLILSGVVWREWGQPAAAGWRVAVLQTVHSRGANFVGLSVNKSRL